MSDELRTQGEALADAVLTAVPGWVQRCVDRFAVDLDATDAGREAVAAIAPPLRDLLTADVDDQRANPLAIVRDAVRFPTAVLRAAGVEPPARSRFDVEHFPDDPYGLVPMTWRDIDESLHEPGIVWGATKAMAHRRRHQA
ncbi:MAG TPA: hypothetical protein VFU93_01645 [Acidimicrobiales bacterium]|nr:hypothetical protein [Acidimicrobiales bacterium]